MRSNLSSNLIENRSREAAMENTKNLIMTLSMVNQFGIEMSLNLQTFVLYT
jgi:hypothetical protein